jgi:hypothetical protein
MYSYMTSQEIYPTFLEFFQFFHSSRGTGGCLSAVLSGSLNTGTTPRQPSLPTPFYKGDYHKSLSRHFEGHHLA